MNPALARKGRVNPALPDPNYLYCADLSMKDNLLKMKAGINLRKKGRAG